MTSHPSILRLLATAALLVMIAACGAVTEPQKYADGKPAAPLSLSVHPVDTDKSAVIELEVEARFLASGRARLQVKLPEQAALYSGDLDWEATLAQPTRHLLRFSVQVPEQGKHVIKVIASLHSGQAAAYTTQAEYVIGTDGVEPDNRPAPVPGWRNGQRIEEQRL